MTWTYMASPAPSAKDEVRLLTGDTASTDQLLQDEEIAFFLTDEGGTYRAAAAAAEAIAARYAREADVQLTANLRLSRSQKQKQYLDLAKRLRQRAARRGITPLAGGISVTQVENAEQNLDRTQPAFTRDMESEPGTQTFEDDNDQRVTPF